MASLIVAETVLGPVTIQAGHVQVGDEVTLTPTMGAVVTASLPLLGSRLPALAVATTGLDGGPAWTQVILPADLTLPVLRAIRAIDHPCQMCGRPARWVFDLATTAAAPDMVICQDCDTPTTEQVRADYTGEHSTAHDHTGATGATSENGDDRHGDDDQQ